jgi:hypothetical protein
MGSVEKSIYDVFATDADKETQGRWYRIGNMEFLLARAGGTNTKFTSAYAAAMRPYQRQQQMGQLTEEAARAVLVVPFSKFVLLDWRTRLKSDGVESLVEHSIPGRDGAQLAYSKDAAAKLMLDIPDLLNTLVEAAGNFSNYAPDDVDEAVKN